MQYQMNQSKNFYKCIIWQKICKNTLIVIKDQDDNIITAFNTQRSIQNLLYSSSELNYTSYKIYTGGSIDGEESNGLYTKINSYTNGEEIQFNEANRQVDFKMNDNSSFILKVLIIEIILLGIFVTIYIIKNRK